MVISDFGISWIMKKNYYDRTATSVDVGAFNRKYAAPEIQNECKHIFMVSDIFSFG